MNGPVVLATPPAPGSAEPANLYVDLQSRALWLGVDQTVDPNGAVLISDIVQTQADIVAAEAAAKAYTDQETALLAPLANPAFTGNPTAPTPPADDNDTSIATTAFVKTALAGTGGGSPGGVLVGSIILWPGTLVDIGTGSLASWHICDGALLDEDVYPALYAVIHRSFTHSSTPAGKFALPDLREKFIVGAGVRQPGDTTKNPSYPQLTSFKTPAAEGTHAHTVGNTTLTDAQMPEHRHSASLSGGTDNQGAHEHRTYTYQLVESGTDIYVTGWSSVGLNAATNTSSNGSHDHNVTVSGNTGYAGSDGAHNHPLTGAGTHQHTVTQQNITQTIPWFALAYIIKIA